MRPELVFLLEEESAAAMLHVLVPRIVGSTIVPRFIPFEGKQDLERNIARKLRGYQNPDARFVIVRDQDSEPDCRRLKAHLARLCRDSGRHPATLVRIACHELESFYLGDLAAVEKGLGLPGIARRQQYARFRDPDRLANPAQELVKLTGGNYQKVSGSRAIAAHLDPDNTRSASFAALVTGIRRIAATLAT